MTILNNPDLVGFYALGAVAIFASLRVVIHANPVHAILSMIVSLLAVAGILFILGAPFAGALEIVVYAGAILVLFVFVIMMLNLGMANESREERWLDARTWAVPTGLTIVIAVVLYALIGINHDEAAVIGGVTVSAKVVGTALFLLAALVAAYHLGKESLNDEIIADNELDIDRRGGNVKNYLHNTTMDINANHVADTADVMPESYEYKDVDPHDYVSAVNTQINTQASRRKESD